MHQSIIMLSSSSIKKLVKTLESISTRNISKRQKRTFFAQTHAINSTHHQGKQFNVMQHTSYLLSWTIRNAQHLVSTRHRENRSALLRLKSRTSLVACSYCDLHMWHVLYREYSSIFAGCWVFSVGSHCPTTLVTMMTTQHRYTSMIVTWRTT